MSFLSGSDISYQDVLLFASLCIELIWKERNKIVHDKERTPLDQLIWELRSLFVSYSAALLQPPQIVSSQLSKWLAPPSPFVKVNVDAAVRSFFSVVAGVARDSEGRVLGVFAEKIASIDPLVAEGSALLVVIDFAVSRDWRFVVL